MARLTGEAARKWLQENPNSSFVDNTTGQKYDKQRSGIEKLGLNLTKPFRSAVGLGQELGLTIQDLINLTQGKNTTKRPDNYALMTEEESQELNKDPLKTGLKAGAGVLAYAIPGGAAKGVTGLKAIGQAAGRGAGAGALGGLGASETGKELESTLGGAGLGALMGGALQGVGEGVKAIKGAKLPKTSEFGLEVRGKAIGLDPNKMATNKATKITSSTEGKKVISEFFDDMDNLKLKTHTSEMASSNADAALATHSDEFKSILQGADNVKTFTAKDTGKIINKIEGAFRNNPKVAQNAQYQELIADLRDLGSSYTPSALNTVREKARELVSWSTANQASVSQRATSEVFDVIDDFFKTNIKGSSDVLRKMKNIYTVRPFFQSKAPGAGAIKVGTASTNIAVPSGAIQERIPEAIGRGLQGVQGGGTSEIPALLQTLIKGGQRAIPAIPGMTGQGMPQQEQQPMESEMPQQGINPLNLMLAQEVLNGTISASEANAVLSLLGMGGTEGKLTEKQKLFKSAGQTADEALAMLEGGQAKTGKIQGVGSAVGKFFGTQNEGQTDYLAKLDGARMAAISALSGANVPPSEYERMRNLIPEPNDEYNIAVQKLRSFKQVMDTYAQSYGGTDNSNILQTLGLQ